VLGGQVVANIVTETSGVSLGVSTMRGTYDPEHSLPFSIIAAHVVFRIRDVFLRFEYLSRKTEMSLGENPMERFRYGPGSDGQWDPSFVKDGAYAELEVPLGSRLTAVLREDGLRRRGNVVMTSEMRSESALLRHTAALAIVLRSQLRLKLSYEYYDFTDFESNSVVHVGIAGPF